MTFSRTIVPADEFKEPDIAMVPVAGGDAVRLGGSERDSSGFEYLGKHWTTEGSRLCVSPVHYQPSGLGPDGGIRVFEAAGETRQLLVGTGPDVWPPRIMAVSPRGERLLVRDLQAAGGRRTLCACSLFDGSTGATEPVEALPPNDRRSTPITGAMLSPDGSMLVTVSGSDVKQVAIREVDGTHEELLVSERRSPVICPASANGHHRRAPRCLTLML